jgi:hypothetical protein
VLRGSTTRLGLRERFWGLDARRFLRLALVVVAGVIVAITRARRR